MSYFKPVSKPNVDIFTKFHSIVSTKDPMDVHDIAIRVIKEHYGLSEFSEEYLSLLDDLVSKYLGEPNVPVNVNEVPVDTGKTIVKRTENRFSNYRL